MRGLLLLFVAVLAAVGAETGPSKAADRGWSEGTPAAQAPAMLAGPRVQEITVPKELVANITGPTVLFYFAPTCPHCRSVAPEVNALSKRIADVAPLLAVASASTQPADLLEFRATFGVDWTILHDATRAIGSAIGARSTPSALLVRPTGKKDRVEVVDLWFPYRPGFDALIEGRARGDLFAAFREGVYLGDNVCGSCHGVEYASHALTHHSIAWNTLVKRNKHEDAACTGCHVTGAGQPGGWGGDPHSKLVNVGCEACHGPGGPHDGVRQDPTTTCVGCHDAQHSIAFTVEKGLPLIDHYRAAHLSEKAFSDARRALIAGEVPRALLAFADGANVGAEACLSCHADQHAHWASSPHANAMATLVTAGKHEDAACVRCHATPTASGPPPTELSGFRVAEGVSCESCHGPGEAHVAAGGGKDNIEGLGDDCPVCVIEAVCTSCHTSEWDPDWDLDRDLPKVGHGSP